MPASRPPVRWARFLASLLAIGLTGLAVALIVPRVVPERSSPGPVDPEVNPEEIVHLHAVGVNPGDGLPYLATHTGVLTYDESGKLVRVADRYQDTMGFVVVEEDRFLASGHPDLREDAPSSLGLVLSDDAARSWQPVSLRGDADLHAIVLAHGKVYAADATSSQILVSEDEGRRWERRGSADVATLVVDPTDQDALVAADHAGRLQRSGDGGRTWQPVEGPSVASLVWDGEVGLVGVGSDGAVYSSDDGGATWRPTGDLGGSGPVITAADGTVWAATEGGRFLRSEDGGTTWTPYRPPGSGRR